MVEQLPNVLFLCTGNSALSIIGKIFTSLPLASLDRIKLQERLDAIGKTGSAEEAT